MSGSHKEFPKKAVAIQLGLAALVGVGFLFADKPAAHASAEKEAKPIVVAAAKILAPIGKVEVKKETGGAAARSGEEIYTTTCGTCHNTGIAGAPKLEEKASWETRLSGGFAALVTSATNGKGGMPARGGNPDISDSEMELVVGYMVKKAGIDLVARSSTDSNATPAAAATETQAVTAVKTEVAPKAEEKVEQVKTDAVAAVASATTAVSTAVDHSAGEAVYKSSCGVCHDSGVAGSPKLGDKEVWAPRIATGTETLYEAAIKGKGAMPAKGGNTSISDADIKAAVDFMTAKSASAAPVPAAASTADTTAIKTEEATIVEKKVEEAKDAVVETVEAASVKVEAAKEVVAETVEKAVDKAKEVKTEVVAAVATTAAKAADHSAGEAVYKSSCFACHDSGVAGSPKVGDNAAWTARIATGNDALYESAIKGKGAMPAKGGNMSISDADIKAAVDYMTANSM